MNLKNICQKMHTYHDIMFGDIGEHIPHTPGCCRCYSDIRKQLTQKQEKVEGQLDNRAGKYIDMHGIEKWISETLGDAEYQKGIVSEYQARPT